MRLVIRIAARAAALALLILSVVGRSGITAWPLELVSNFPVQLFAAAVLVTTVAALARSRVAIALGVVAALINAATILPVLERPGPRPPAGTARLTLAHLNAQSGRIDVVALRAYLRRRHPDVFIVLDPAQSTVLALRNDAAGYDVHTTATRESAWVRTIVLSRAEVHTVGHPDDPRFPPATVVFEVALGAATVAVLALHTESPTTPGRAGHRNRALRAAARWASEQHARRIVMGDFNATPWSPIFHGLLRDSHLHSSLDGFGIQASWPSSNPLFGIPIDHALLSSDLTTIDRGTCPAFGSQHHCLVVTIASAGR